MFKIQIKTYTRIFGMIVDHYSIQIYKDTNIENKILKEIEENDSISVFNQEDKKNAIGVVLLGREEVINKAAIFIHEHHSVIIDGSEYV